MSIRACAELVRKGDPDRFMATMAAPPTAREKLFPLYAFNLEVARAPWVTSEPMIAEMRLQWWRDALQEIAAGGPVRSHEVVTPLSSVLDPAGARMLDGLVAARRWDCYREPFADAAAFDAHIDATAGHLTWAAARALGAGSGEPVVRDLAFGAGVANWLLAVPALVAHGRIPLPDGGDEGIAALAERALSRLRRARAGHGRVAAVARPALMAGWRAEAVLRRAHRDPSKVAEGRLEGSEFARRGGLLWRSLTGRW